jgi:hypothetical protein
VGRFFGNIPWWLYVILILLGVALSLLFFILWGKARRRAAFQAPPGAPVSGTGTGLLVGAILTSVLLVLAPLIIMLVAQPWSRTGSSSRSSETRYDRDRGSDRDDADSSNEGSEREDQETSGERSGGVPGRYVDGPAGASCEGDDVVEFTEDGRVLLGDRTMATWREDGGELIMTQEGDDLVFTRTRNGLKVRDSNLSRCE